MTTLVELVGQTPNDAFGIPTQLPGGPWRWVLELADPSAGASVEWYDITDLCTGVSHTRGADEFAGKYRASVVELELVADDDALAPWNPDTSAVFGTHVDLGAGLLIRGGFIRVSGGAVTSWRPRFTVRVETWRDAAFARGQIRIHDVTCRDLLTGLNNVPVGDAVAGNWDERLSHIMSEAEWDFGLTVYGADQAPGPVDVLELPARDEQSNALLEMDATCDPAGLVWYTSRVGRIIVRPQPGDTFHADHFAGGATGTEWVEPEPVTFSYNAELDDGVAYDTEGPSPFGLEDTEVGIVNHVRITDPAPGLFDDDDLVSVGRYGRKTRSMSWQVANDQVGGDILARLAFATKQATPLETHVDAVNFFPAAADLDWLYPVGVKHATAADRDHVVADGTVRQIIENIAPLGEESIDWTMTVTIDIATYESGVDLLPVEDLAVSNIDHQSADFDWTNPTQVITPTATLVRIPELSAVWIELSYPVTSFDWFGLDESTAYTFQVRLIREVGGVITNVSPIAEVTFTTDDVPVVDVEPDGDGGFDVDLPDVGDCEVAWTLEGFDGEDWVEIDSGTDPSGTVLNFDAELLNGYYLFNLCSIEMCEGEPPGDEYCVTSIVAACTTPPAFTAGDPPYDSPNLIAFIPEACPIDLVKEALSGIPGGHGPAWGGLTYVGAADIALKADTVGGVIAQGAVPALAYYGTATIGCRTSPQTGADHQLFSIAGMRLESVDGTTGWFPKAIVTTVLGETLSVTDATERSAVTPARELHATYDADTGTLELVVDGVSRGTDVADDPADRANQGPFWRCSAPANGWVTDCAVWDSAIGVVRPSVTVEQAAAQDDPAGTEPIVFEAVFSEEVTGFTDADVTLSGTAGATTADVSTADNITFTIEVSGMTSDGTVICSIGAAVCTSVANGTPNLASTSTDNTVTWSEAVLSDNFNRANETLDTSPHWTAPSADLLVSSNELRFANTGNADAIFATALPSVNMFAEIDVLTETGTNRYIGLCIRNQSPTTLTGVSDSHYMARYMRTDGRWEIHRFASSAYTLLANNTANDPTTPYRIRFEAETVSGDVVLRLKEWNGSSWTTRLTFTDTSGSKILTGDYTGIRVNRATTLSGDNWQIGTL